MLAIKNEKIIYDPKTLPLSTIFPTINNSFTFENSIFISLIRSESFITVLTMSS